jgi:hypothetical protein
MADMLLAASGPHPAAGTATAVSAGGSGQTAIPVSAARSAMPRCDHRAVQAAAAPAFSGRSIDRRAHWRPPLGRPRTADGADPAGPVITYNLDRELAAPDVAAMRSDRNRRVYGRRAEGSPDVSDAWPPSTGRPLAGRAAVRRSSGRISHRRPTREAAEFAAEPATDAEEPREREHRATREQRLLVHDRATHRRLVEIECRDLRAGQRLGGGSHEVHIERSWPGSVP